jgi:uncharacterized protein (TIGR02246 family)
VKKVGAMSRAAWAFTLAAALFAFVLFGVLRVPAYRERRRKLLDQLAPPPSPAPSAMPDPEALHAEIAAAIAEANRSCLAALERGDARAYASHFVEDAISLPARGPIVRGRAAIERAMAEAFRSARFGNAEWRTIDTRTNGSTAYETGTYAFVVFNSAERSRPQTLKGRYFVVWKRAAGGWKIAYDASQPGAAG